MSDATPLPNTALPPPPGPAGVQQKSPADIALDRYKARLWFINAILATIMTSGIAVAIPAGVQAYKSYLELALKNKELETEAVKARNEYVAAFLAKGIDQDIEIRLRLSQYFSFVAGRDDLKSWDGFHSALERRRDELRKDIGELEDKAFLLRSRKDDLTVDEAVALARAERALNWDYAEIGYVRPDASISAPSRRDVADTSVDPLQVVPEYDRIFASLDLAADKVQQAQIDASIEKIVANRKRYQTVAMATGVPWYMIGIIHLRENGGDFDRHLVNGDPLTDRTKNVPAGRPADGMPPFTWEASAEDAFHHAGITVPSSPSPGSILWAIERWNGVGFKRQGYASPYIWRCTTHDSGDAKFSTGLFYAAAGRSGGCGAAAILKLLVKRDIVAF